MLNHIRSPFNPESFNTQTRITPEIIEVLKRGIEATKEKLAANVEKLQVIIIEDNNDNTITVEDVNKLVTENNRLQKQIDSAINVINNPIPRDLNPKDMYVSTDKMPDVHF